LLAILKEEGVAIMMKRGWVLFSVFFAVLGFSIIANAGLTVIGTATYNGKDYNLICEDDQGLIWLDYSNRRAGGWENSMKWASGLNDPGVLTYKFNPGVSVSWDGDWRLPKTVDGPRRWGYDGTTTAGCNITTSEMGHLYYVSLGNVGHYDTNGELRTGWGSDAAYGLKKKGPFTNIYPDTYWSGTEYSIYNQHAWTFRFAFGTQSNGVYKSHYTYSALAIRPGKVVSAHGR